MSVEVVLPRMASVLPLRMATLSHWTEPNFCRLISGLVDGLHVALEIFPVRIGLAAMRASELFWPAMLPAQVGSVNASASLQLSNRANLLQLALSREAPRPGTLITLKGLPLRGRMDCRSRRWLSSVVA